MLALACSQFVQCVHCVKCCIAMACLCALTIKSWCNRATAGWLRKLQQTVLPAFNSEVLKSLKMLSCSQLYCPDSTSCIELTMPSAINMSNTCWLELGRFFLRKCGWWSLSLIGWVCKLTYLIAKAMSASKLKQVALELQQGGSGLLADNSWHMNTSSALWIL